ncbi:hypothetical protein [uncultured Desulfobacter sp.]|uniref:hypothetical protein n=1 Tax=uncultured Desulfobacter sp. TaxID=240139 RepID=UPI002AA65778|nr:hypothetical protein [uncultured Desulfobacter sp.]
MQRSFKVIAERYYEQALTLEREYLNERGLTLPVKATLKARIMNYGDPTVFFTRCLLGECPFEGTTESQRYGLLSVIYEKFDTICDQLPETGIHPPEGEGLYFAALHRLTQDITTYAGGAQRGAAGSKQREINSFLQQSAVAKRVIDDFPLPAEGGRLEIPRGYWDNLLTGVFEGVRPSQKTLTRYKHVVEAAISKQRHNERLEHWISLPSDISRPPKPVYRQIKIKFKK